MTAVAMKKQAKDDHKLVLELYGSDLRMRIQHLDPETISAFKKGEDFFGSGADSSRIVDYPKKANGTATDIHIHVDMTRKLPYNGRYERLFVNPFTLQKGEYYDYEFGYKDKDKKYLPEYPKNFVRGF